MRRFIVGAAVLLLVLAMLVLLAACGSSTSSSSSGTPSASASGATAATVEGIPVTTDPSLKAMLPSSNQSSGQIRCASDIPYPPWEYYDPSTSTNPAGFDYDLSQMIGAKIGVKVSFNKVPFATIFLSVKGGKNDMLMSDAYDTVDREKQGISFVGYAADSTSIVVKKGNPNGITSANDLSGKTVACESGTTQEAYLKVLNAQFASDGKAKVTVLALPDQPAALLAVTTGRAVGDLTDTSTGAYIAKTTNNGNTYELVVDPAAPTGYFPQLVAAGINASNTQLINTVQKAIQALIDDGTYTKLIDAWAAKGYHFTPVTSAQVNAGPAYAKASLASASASPSP